ncbi:hypothetical protein T484DRAFT_1960969 [Baffinella frigidus]|nr:hypothetical protein T484DRAFT_1960969 [Cryptophyta sp. CCMP2293]
MEHHLPFRASGDKALAPDLPSRPHHDPISSASRPHFDRISSAERDSAGLRFFFAVWTGLARFTHFYRGRLLVVTSPPGAPYMHFKR